MIPPARSLLTKFNFLFSFDQLSKWTTKRWCAPMALDECVRQVTSALISGPPSQNYSVPPIIPIWGKVTNKVDAFELWSWRRLLRVLWTARRSNQSILQEISPEYSLEGLMLKLKLQYLDSWCEELTHWKIPWFWERLKPGEGYDRGWDSWMTSLTGWTWVSASSGGWWWTGKPGVARSWTWMSAWTELIEMHISFFFSFAFHLSSFLTYL